MILSKRNKVISGVLSIVLLLVTSVFYLQINEETVNQSLQEKFTSQLESQESILQNELSKFTSQSVSTSSSNYFSKLHEEEGISLYIYTDSVLTFWSDNEEPNNNLIALADGYFKSAGGYYKKLSISKGKETFVGTLCIKREHRFENSFVKNNFQKKFSLTHGCNLEIQHKTIVLLLNEVDRKDN